MLFARFSVEFSSQKGYSDRLLSRHPDWQVFDGSKKDSDALELSLGGDSIPELRGLAGGVLVDEIQVEGAAVVATHGRGWRRGTPAVTVNRFGEGTVVYLGLRLSAPLFAQLERR